MSPACLSVSLSHRRCLSPAAAAVFSDAHRTSLCDAVFRVVDATEDPTTGRPGGVSRRLRGSTHGPRPHIHDQTAPFPNSPAKSKCLCVDCVSSVAAGGSMTSQCRRVASRDSPQTRFTPFSDYGGMAAAWIYGVLGTQSGSMYRWC